MPRHAATQRCPFCTPILCFLLAHATAHMTQQVHSPSLAPQLCAEPSLEQIEAEFWRIVESPEEQVESLYGQVRLNAAQCLLCNNP